MNMVKKPKKLAAPKKGKAKKAPDIKGAIRTGLNKDLNAALKPKKKAKGSA